MNPPAWPTVPYDCPPLDDMDAQDRAYFHRLAVSWLWAWTGRTFGHQTWTVRPPVGVCDRPQAVTLAGPAIRQVDDVEIGGLPFHAWRLHRPATLVRTDGQPWPPQDITADDGQEGSWQVTYQTGLPVPEAGLHAAAVLACELAKARRGVACRLPQRVQTVIREGVTVGFFDDFATLWEGRTGLFEVDMWVASVGAPGRSRVVVP